MGAMKLRRDGVVVAHRQAGQERLEAGLDRHVVLVRVGAQTRALDRLALRDHLVHEVRVLIGEVGPHRVEARVHEPLEEGVVPRGGARLRAHLRADYPPPIAVTASGGTPASTGGRFGTAGGSTSACGTDSTPGAACGTSGTVGARGASTRG